MGQLGYLVGMETEVLGIYLLLSVLQIDRIEALDILANKKGVEIFPAFLVR